VVRRDHAPALDGIRGIAILAVVLFHCSLRLQGSWRIAGSWGWVGVDLFFVLSSYLITGILLDARDVRSRFYYGGFYGRRILRIVPAFVVLMVALVSAPALTGQSTEAHVLLASHQAWYWTFLANALIATYGWAAVIPQTAPLWSLAVEEQFYLIWPSVVRHLTPRGVLRLGVALIVLVAAARIVFVRRGVNVITLYASMPTRADLLAWGAVLAALVRLPNGIPVMRRWLWPALFVASVVVVTVTVAFRSSYYWSAPMVMAGYPAIAVAAACLVAIAIVYEPRALRFSWLTGIGRVSYGLYLWHMTGIAVVAQLLGHVSAWLIPLAFLLSLVPTLLSWYLIEQPALSLKRYAPMRPAEVHAEQVAMALLRVTDAPAATPTDRSLLPDSPPATEPPPTPAPVLGSAGGIQADMLTSDFRERRS
jgi:peptidoglycan/LPS O-acetylase OafA/YrhL